MPIENWMAVHKTADLRHILILDDYTHLPEVDHDLTAAWMALYDQYIAEFGITDRYREYMMKKIEIAKKQIEWIQTGDATLQTFIEIGKIEMKEMLDENEQVKFHDTIALIEKYMGFQVDTYRVTVLKYYTYLRQIEKTYRSNGKN